MKNINEFSFHRTSHEIQLNEWRKEINISDMHQSHRNIKISNLITFTYPSKSVFMNFPRILTKFSATWRDFSDSELNILVFMSTAWDFLFAIKDPFWFVCGVNAAMTSRGGMNFLALKKFSWRLKQIENFHWKNLLLFSWRHRRLSPMFGYKIFSTFFFWKVLWKTNF